METQKPLLKDEDGEKVDVHKYRSMIGLLMYLTLQDLTSCLQCVHAVKNIFRCLKGQPKLGLWYPKDFLFDLVAYINIDYAGASLDRKFTTGGCQFLRCRLISWQCKKHIMVVNSITEAEYVATSSCCGQVLWIQNQLLDYGKPKRKDTQIPQPSDPTDNITDEAVHKELGDSLVRAATTASSLEAEQDNGDGLGCQETIWDTTVRTRFESAYKHSNDSLLTRVLNLEKTNTTKQNKIATQQQEIASLKRSVKKLEKRNRSRNHGLKRLYKVGLTGRVESSGDKQSLGEDESKQGRIDAIDVDEDITLVSVQDDADKDVFDVNVLDGDEVFIAKQNENVFEEVVDAAQAQEQEELSMEEKAKLFQLLEKRIKHFDAKREEEKRNKPPTKAQQRKTMCTYLKNMERYKLKDLQLKEFDSIQEMFDRAFKRQKVEDGKEIAKLKQFMETIQDEKEVAIDVLPLAVKSPKIVG
uniref:Uncharacterized protein n=1 Tax=Tanacetum cinerariifolium TaxID=118510 RepID=A0A6L2KF44_TANCI|nr:hypothetical protein [Tanacetum cinerariifolium]